MNKALYDEKEKLLKEQYKDLFQKNDEEEKKAITKLKKSEFFELLKINLNNFIFSKINKIQKTSRFFSVQEVKDILIKSNNFLKKANFNLLYYTLENQYYIPKDETTFIDNRIDDFALILVDINNEEGNNKKN